MNSNDGVSAEELPAIKAGIMALTAGPERWAAVDRMLAKPWRGSCPGCPSAIWCTDTEEEAGRLVAEHIAASHVVLPQVWRDHE